MFAEAGAFFGDRWFRQYNPGSDFLPRALWSDFNTDLGNWHVGGYSVGNGYSSFARNTSDPIEGTGHARLIMTWPASGSHFIRMDNGPIAAADRTADGLTFGARIRLAAGGPTDITAQFFIYADGADRPSQMVNLVPGQVVDVYGTFASTHVDSMQHPTIELRRGSSTAVSTTIDIDQVRQGDAPVLPSRIYSTSADWEWAMSSGLGVETPNARTYDQPTPEDRPSAAMVVNAGNATSSRVKITVHGPLVAGDWSLVNETTDQSQSIDLTIPVDGVIEIDSHEETVILAGVDYVSRTYGDWIRLAPGTNTLRLVTGATNEAAYMTVESYSSWR
jgi:hypothetical protein